MDRGYWVWRLFRSNQLSLDLSCDRYYESKKFKLRHYLLFVLLDCLVPPIVTA